MKITKRTIENCNSQKKVKEIEDYFNIRDFILGEQINKFAQTGGNTFAQLNGIKISFKVY